MGYKQGFTLMEIIVVLIIIGLVAAFAIPSFTGPTEQARASTARNNLLAIYGAQRNYYNNNNDTYCISSCDSLPDINTAFSLNIQDDNTYAYACTGVTCTATRNGTTGTIVLTLNTPINLSGTGTANPQCNLSNNWCP